MKFKSIIKQLGVIALAASSAHAIDAEKAKISGGLEKAGSGKTQFVKGFSAKGAEATFDMRAHKAGPFECTIRYAAGAGDVEIEVDINDGDFVENVRLPSTGNWETWSHKYLSLPLTKEGNNKITIRSKGADFYLDSFDTTFRFVAPAMPSQPEFSPAETKAKLTEACAKLEKAGIDSLVVAARRFIKSSHNYTYYNEAFLPGGGLYLLKDGELKELVNSKDGEILDCELSYDGKQILFSWKKDRFTNYDVYCINLDGTGLRQITKHPAHDFNATWLPDGGIAFLSDRDNNYAYCMGSSSAVLYRMQPDGSNLKRLSANYLSDITPKVMNNGKIMYTRWEYVDRFQIPCQGIWAQNPDGTGLVHIYGNRVIEPITISDAKNIPGSNKILGNLTGHGGPLNGGIGIVDPSMGAQNPKATKTILGNAIHMKQNRNRYPGNFYELPYPVNSEYFLCSNDGSIELATYEGKTETILERELVPGGLPQGFFSVVPVQTRQKEPVIGSALPEEKTGLATIVMQDVYIGLEDQIKAGTIKRGDVKQIRVVEQMAKHNKGSQAQYAFCWQFPIVSAGATMEPKRTISVVEIEEDGSAKFEVPANTPLIFQALDKDGRVIQRMRTFGQFMDGETQSCTGCHSDRNNAVPPNKAQIMALQKPSQKITGPRWEEHKDGFSYIEQVQPILDRNCVQCHNPRRKLGGFDLSGDRTDLFNVSYDNLARQEGNKNPARPGWGAGFKHDLISFIPSYNGMHDKYLAPEMFEPFAWGAYQSKLAELIRTGHKDANGNDRLKRMTDLEKRIIYAWIDYNIPYYHTSHTNFPESKQGMRGELIPVTLDAELKDLAARRCVECHAKPSEKTAIGGWFCWNDKNRNKTDLRPLPLDHYLRWEKPELNNFLMAPLAPSAGGLGMNGKWVFKDKNDPDYQKILKLFEPLHEKVKERPRMDMPGAPEIRQKEHTPLYTNKEEA